MSDATDVPERLREALADRYRVERQLGQGGMATVYLAEDLKHERLVAIKVLKPELAAVIGAERFVTEIKTTAALQHPHILPLFDSGETDGFLYYVMPYIEGETLRDRLDHERQLPVEESVKLAKAVADALDYAHRHEVIHRDIKPENILLHEGNPVVADFGIALAISAAGGGRLTETGLSLGTPHYMSPEQASADRDLTARSDVYSLGAVLYEMLAGDPPHTGPSAQAILMRILTEDPRPVTDQRRSVPPNVAAAVAKALEKLPADRFESAAAFGGALEDAAFTYAAPQRAATASASPAGHADAAAPRGGGSWWTDVRSVAVMALLVVAMGALGFSLRGPDDGEPGTVVRAALLAEDVFMPAISHDGSMVAYGNREGLWLQHLDQMEPVRLVAGDINPFAVFSPDDEWIAWVDGQRGLSRVSVRGGSPIKIVEAPGGGFASDWTDDGRIVYTIADGTYTVPWTGEGEARRVLEGGLFAQIGARFLPGSNVLIYTEHAFGAETGRIRLRDLDTGVDSVIIEDGMDARYAASGHLLFGRADQSLFAVPFDRDELALAGSEVSVLDSVGVATFLGVALFDVSDTGTAVYSLRSIVGPSAGDGSQEMVFVQDGVATAIGMPPAAALADPKISPDGRLLVYARDNTATYVYDMVVGTNSPVSSTATPFIGGVWRPDGASVDGVGFSGGIGIFNVTPGAGEEPAKWRDSSDGSFVAPMDWTRAGDRLVVGMVGGDNPDLYILTVEPDTVLTPFLDSDWTEEAAVLSPDDRWVAYASNQGGQAAIYVRSFPEPGPPVRVSPGAGTDPAWAPGGDRIYYRLRDSVMVADVDAEDGFSVGEVRSLFGGYPPGSFDVMPDGRLVMVRDIEAPGGPADDEAEPAEPDDPGPQNFVVVNWFEELRARFGGGG